MSTLPTMSLLSALIFGQVTGPEVDKAKPREGPAGLARQVPVRPDRSVAATPQQQDQTRMDRLVEEAARTYRLDEMQKARVRAEIIAMHAERRAAMGPQAAEYDRLREEIARLWKGSPGDGTAEDPPRRRFQEVRSDRRFLEIRKRMAEIDRKYPFDWGTAIQRVEALLPPEQVEKGHALQEQRATARAAARERRLERQASPSADPLAPGSAGAPMRLESGPPTPPPTDSERLAANASKPEPAEQPIHPWERYTRKFIADRALTDVQANSALSILKDLRTRAEQIERSNADRMTAARQIPDIAARDKRIAELTRPIDPLFDELKRRLDSLLTAAQRVKTKP